MTKKVQSRDKGQSFLRAFNILTHLTSAARPPSISDISIATGLARPTISRLCLVLEREGLVVRDMAAKRYGVGWRLWQFAASVIGSAATQRERRLILCHLVEEIGETCNLTVPNGTKMVYIDRVECNWPLRLELPIGSEVPLHCTPSGKLYLGLLPPSRRQTLLGRLKFEKHTPNTVTSAKQLNKELIKIRKNMVAFDCEEFVDGMNSVAVPILDSYSRLWATLAVHGPVNRFSLKKAKDCVPMLRAAATKLCDLAHAPELERHKSSKISEEDAVLLYHRNISG
jgi:DNA-binding IclR family transcriptional regulator